MIAQYNEKKNGIILNDIVIFLTFRLEVINETSESLIVYYYGCAYEVLLKRLLIT